MPLPPPTSCMAPPPPQGNKCTQGPPGAGMDPAREAGDTPGYAVDTGTPVALSRTATGASERGGGALGQAPETAKKATARSAADIQTPKVTGAAGTPRHNDQGSAGTTTTEEQQEETRTKAEAQEDAKIARDLPTRGPAYQGTCLPGTCHQRTCYPEVRRPRKCSSGVHSSRAFPDPTTCMLLGP